MKVTKYISVFALAILFAATSCEKMDGLQGCKSDQPQEEVEESAPAMMGVSEGEEDYNPGGITDPDHDEDHDRDEEKVVAVN
jgi:hypothetical protein